MEDLKEKSINELIKVKNIIENLIIQKKLKENGLDKKLLDKYGNYYLFFRTPLHKNKYVVGIPIKDYQDAIDNKIPIILVIKDSKRCNDYLFYVFTNEDINKQFLSGYTHTTQYIYYKISVGGKKIPLKMLEEFL